MNPVKEFLSAEMQCRELMKNPHRIGNYSCLTDFILKHGREFRYSELPKHIVRGHAIGMFVGLQMAIAQLKDSV